MRAMLSIKPEYVARILSGEKTYEYRRRVFRKADVDKIVIYSTSPQSAVVAEADIDRVLEAPPEDLWRRTGTSGGIGKEKFMAYFHDVDTAYAIKLKDVIRLKTPQVLSEYAPSVKRPPQSFVYLDQ
jgi:predicted transcriptional regulator